MTVLNLIRPELLNSANYVPGGENTENRLHANELPWSPINSANINLNIYPAVAFQSQLKQKLALRFDVGTDQLVITRGSDECIDLITRLFLTAGQDALMQFPPTFPMYAFYARIQQAELIQCALDPINNFTTSLDKINSQWKPNCKVILFCSPNNPTGNLIDLDLIKATCEQYKDRSVVVVDEAYIEFSKAQSATTLINQYENLIVLRTLSKAGGLAGLRLGCILAQTHIIQAVMKIIPPYTISNVVIDLANKALQLNDWFPSAVEAIQASRDVLMSEFKKLPIFEKIYPSEANFILVQTPYAKELTTWFSNLGIAIRDFPINSILHNHLRITVGSEQQNKLVLTALSSFINNVSGLKNAENLIY